MTSSVVGLRGNSKALSKAKLVPKNVTVTVWWSAGSLIPLQLSESQQNHYNWEVCSANPWLQSLQPALLNRKGPILLHNTWLHQHFKSWTNWAMKLCLICHIQLTTTYSSISTTFCRKTLPQWEGGRKCFPRVHWIPMHRFLSYRNKETYFLLAKMYWL